MDKDLFVDKFIQVQDACDINVLHRIINNLDDEVLDTLLRSEKISDEVYSYLYWRKNLDKKEEIFHKNESVEQLLEWYCNPKSKKVGYAREQINRRFLNLSFEEQCLIIEAFMQSGKVSDISTCCKYLVNDEYWKEEYIPIIESFYCHCVNEYSRVAYSVAKVIVKHSSKIFVENALKELDSCEVEDSYLRNVLILLLISCEGHPHKLLRNNVLSSDEYLYVLSRKGLVATEEEVLKALNEIAADDNVPTYKIRSVVRSVAGMGYYDMLFDFGVRIKDKGLKF